MSETIVLITGGNQGLGFEVVKKLAAENEHYRILLCSRNLDRGQRAASEVTKLAKGTNIDVLQLDVTSDESIISLAKSAGDKYGRIDVLFNNAGIGYGDEGKTQREKMHQIYDVNVASVVAVTDALIPLLKKSKIPRIVIMSSDLGSIANTLNPDHPSFFYQEVAYKASKAAVNMVGAVYSNTCKSDGIRVNLVNPGFRATNFNNNSELAGRKEDGAIEPCRVITLGDAKDTGTYTEIEGPIPW